MKPDKFIYFKVKNQIIKTAFPFFCLFQHNEKWPSIRSFHDK
ncbi:hypothetical protein YPPY13_3403 [Yersinia pestis PY-13]|uniref:Uncharacterized protein n=2 Tax=Yersinia pestis TaxID=632 RepID=A0AAV3BD72_YERPE|nr:hypothetical protein YPIP275_1647 [Yersinia pestis biovar Orientalis str. IP275]EDR56704.1 hypothetical protein YpMG051020_4420 [Yersinia pestis biovar Orientalis str. MG05-1020]EIQ87094.1 hypothetical protein YPPY02_3370 [Yersinia pestis PY-02]EIQ87442.1 hypothetical protein YPPY03_3433 [Yersinia pestis PY-03]EIQ99583.1 hypothetical protein YPPY04_3382 [Yersinia pestis PY-04]EIR00715.1 hypothetical protein YPPY05_3359 [Yersinia pestis PY-05]EIR04098.1 hypothetical protein YPPY06_3419 [Yer